MSRRPSPVFLLLLGACGAGAWMAWTETAARYSVFVFVLTGWVVSLCLHEYAHARTALWAGDTGVIGMGYLTLNPARYVEPGLSIALPLFFLLLGGIGLPGGAVYLRPGLMRTRWQRSLVSLAGPFSNIVVGLLLVLPFRLSPSISEQRPYFAAGLAFLAVLQFIAALLNLVPIPGLDGFGAVEPFLSPRALQRIAPFRPYSMVLLFLLVFQSRIFNDLVFGNAYRIVTSMSVPEDLARVGYELFRFWMR